MILSPSKDNLDRANVNSSFRHGCFHTFFQACATLLISRAHPIQAYTHFPSVYCLGYRILNSPLDLYLLVSYSSYVSPLAFQSHNCLGHNSNIEHCWQIAVFIHALTPVLPRLWTVPHSSGAQSHLPHQQEFSLLRAIGEHASAHQGLAPQHTKVFLWFAAQGKHLYCNNMDLPTGLVSLNSLAKMKAKWG